jgi:hypothetical protein
LFEKQAENLGKQKCENVRHKNEIFLPGIRLFKNKTKNVKMLWKALLA